MTDQTPPDTATDKPSRQSDATSIEHNKSASRRWIEVFNQRDDVGEADVRARDYVAYAPVSLEPAPLDSEAWTRVLAGFVEAFPDLQLTVEDAVAEGDLVAQRVHFEGTHTGEFQGLPPTHRKVSLSGLELNRFVDGRVAEHWFQMDSLTLPSAAGSHSRARPATAAGSPEPSVEEAAQETLIKQGAPMFRDQRAAIGLSAAACAVTLARTACPSMRRFRPYAALNCGGHRECE